MQKTPLSLRGYNGSHVDGFGGGTRHAGLFLVDG